MQIIVLCELGHNLERSASSAGWRWTDLEDRLETLETALHRKFGGSNDDGLIRVERDARQSLRDAEMVQIHHQAVSLRQHVQAEEGRRTS